MEYGAGMLAMLGIAALILAKKNEDFLISGMLIDSIPDSFICCNQLNINKVSLVMLTHHRQKGDVRKNIR